MPNVWNTDIEFVEPHITIGMVFHGAPTWCENQTWVNYTSKISIKLQLLKKPLNYNYNYSTTAKESQLNYKYNYIKVNSTKLDTDRQHLHINFIIIIIIIYSHIGNTGKTEKCKNITFMYTVWTGL